MIVLLITLWSLCAIYFTHLLLKRKMKVAAAIYTVLYGYVIVWTYLMFIVDIADLGFVYQKADESIIFGGDIFHAFSALANYACELPIPFLKAIAAVCIAVIVMAVAVILVGGFRAGKEIRRILGRRSAALSHGKQRKPAVFTYSDIRKPVPILQMYCRANC